MSDTGRPVIEIQVSELRDGTLVRVRGEIDMSTVGTLSDALEPSSLGNRLVLDLADVSFIGSTGLTLFITLRRQLADLGATLVLRQPQPQAVRLLEVTDLDGVFEIESGPPDDGVLAEWRPHGSTHRSFN